MQVWGEEPSRQRAQHMCKSPGAGLCLTCWRNSEEAHVAGAE